MDDIKDRLAQMNNDWTTAEPPAGFTPGEKLTAGEHTTTITKSEVFETTTGKLMWLIVYTDEHGREGEKWHNLDRRDSVPYIKQDALALGYTGDLPGLVDWAGSIIGSVCRIRVKFKQSDQGGDPFMVIYLNEVIDLKTSPVTSQATSNASGPGTTDADDIPFAPTAMDSFL